MSKKQMIYIAYMVDIAMLTEKDLQIKFASYKARFPERTFEDFLRFEKSWNNDKYSFDVSPCGYFFSLSDAENAVINNIADINECGAYPYAIISEMPVGVMYPESNDREQFIYKYDKATELYNQIKWTDSEALTVLKIKGECGLF